MHWPITIASQARINQANVESFSYTCSSIKVNYMNFLQNFSDCMPPACPGRGEQIGNSTRLPDPFNPTWHCGTDTLIRIHRFGACIYSDAWSRQSLSLHELVISLLRLARRLPLEPSSTCMCTEGFRLILQMIPPLTLANECCGMLENNKKAIKNSEHFQSFVLIVEMPYEWK